MLLTKRFAAGAFAGLLCASILAAPAAAQTTATASINAKASVSGIAALTAAGVNDLDFGVVTAGTPKTPTGPSNDGRFNISGQPSTPVTMPTGIWTGLSARRATVSALMSNAGPANKQPASNMRCGLPTVLRTMCGTISPTKPTRPATETAEEAAKIAVVANRKRAFSTDMPSALAVESPSSKTSK